MPSSNHPGSRPARSTVLAAMSGGVDSSVTAALLGRAGHDVTGATMLLQDPPEGAPDNVSPEARDARAVCKALGIPFLAIDLRREFARCVIDPFCTAYLTGTTPNPCVACNRHLKFGALHRLREELGLDHLATGHYARCAFNEKTGRHEVLRGLDRSKDQSYVLYQLKQDQLAHTLLPLGEHAKGQVRAIAHELGLSVADKPESQDICFVPDGDHLGFIARRTGAELQPGPIVDVEGNVLGTHRGLPAYTIGQRKGLGVAWSEPLFVLRKELESNALVVGTRAQQGQTTVCAVDVNLVSRASLEEPLRVTAKTHYRMREAPATARVREDGVLEAVFDHPVRACAPGQALVLYEGDAVVGGGTII